MPYDVSSGFISYISGDTPNVFRGFYIGDSDYSSFVKKWPTISRNWNEIKPVGINIELGNQDKTFNFFKNNPVTIVNSCRIEFGVEYAVGSTEAVDVYRGKISDLQFQGTDRSATVVISLKDKLKTFAERVIGDDDNPVDFTGSSYLVHDIAWYLVTSYGGFSALESTSNPDINYEAFVNWSGVFSDGNVRMKAFFDGQKLSNILKRLGKMTDSSIVVEDDLLTFARYETSSVGGFDIGSKCILGTKLQMKDEDIINRQIWQADYDIDSDYYQITVTQANSTSVNSYGSREDIQEDDKMWYVDSVSALNMTQRIIDLYSDPIEKYELETTLRPISRVIGDTVTFNNDLLGVTGDTYRLLGYTLNLQSSKMKLKADASQLRTFFTLDDSTLGALDESYNPLG